MKIVVNLKNIKNITKEVKEHIMEINYEVKTVKEFLIEVIKLVVIDYNRRNIESNNFNPLTNEQMDEYREIGKFVFGVHYNTNEISEKEAIDNTLTSFNEGLVRVFHNAKELKNIEDYIHINEGDRFTFIKLTMLSGRMW